MRPPNHNLFAISGLAEPTAFVGTPDQVEKMYARLLPLADQYIMLGMTQMQGDGPFARILALLSARLERWDGAIEHFEDAIVRLRRLDARPLLARTQYELARALRSRGRAHVDEEPRARAMLAEARAIAEELELSGLLRLIGEPLEPGVAPAPPAPAARAPAPGASFAMTLEGEYWTVTRPTGPALRLKDSLGLQYLARLLAEPGRELHVLDLVGGGLSDDQTVDTGDAGELLDDEARAEYGRRLEDLRETLAEAESFGDTARAARAREEIDFLAAELGRAVGLGGRARRAGSAAERARSAVQRRIKNALVRIGEAAPELGAVLARTVRTGNFCVYRPEA